MKSNFIILLSGLLASTCKAQIVAYGNGNSEPRIVGRVQFRHVVPGSENTKVIHVQHEPGTIHFPEESQFEAAPRRFRRFRLRRRNRFPIVRRYGRIRQSIHVQQVEAHPVVGAIHAQPVVGAIHAQPVVGAIHAQPLLGPIHPQPLVGPIHPQPLVGPIIPHPLVAPIQPTPLGGSIHPIHLAPVQLGPSQIQPRSGFRKLRAFRAIPVTAYILVPKLTTKKSRLAVVLLRGCGRRRIQRVFK